MSVKTFEYSNWMDSGKNLLNYWIEKFRQMRQQSVETTNAIEYKASRIMSADTAGPTSQLISKISGKENMQSKENLVVVDLTQSPGPDIPPRPPMHTSVITESETISSSRRIRNWAEYMISAKNVHIVEIIDLTCDSNQPMTDLYGQEKPKTELYGQEEPITELNDEESDSAGRPPSSIPAYPSLHTSSSSSAVPASSDDDNLVRNNNIAALPLPQATIPKQTVVLNPQRPVELSTQDTQTTTSHLIIEPVKHPIAHCTPLEKADETLIFEVAIHNFNPPPNHGAKVHFSVECISKPETGCGVTVTTTTVPITLPVAVPVPAAAAAAPPKRYSVGPLIECPVCMEPLFRRPIVATSCGHLFCRECIELTQSRSDRCAICRKDMGTIIDIFL